VEGFREGKKEMCYSFRIGYQEDPLADWFHRDQISLQRIKEFIKKIADH